MDKVLEQELTSVIQSLSPRDVWLVVGYAKTLQTKPAISELGETYLDMLARDGASAAEIARATLAVQEVEERYARLSAEEAIYDLERRTEAHMRVWLKERGLDYDILTDEQFDQIVDEAVHCVRNTFQDRRTP
jgi:GAF domain-containing protein